MSRGIPLPFVLADGNRDLGNIPISEDIIGIFQYKRDYLPSPFNDVTSQISEYVYGDPWDRMDDGVKQARWVSFQNDKLIPAINIILENIDKDSTLVYITEKYGDKFNPRSVIMSALTGPTDKATHSCDEYNKTITNKLSRLEFYATNLFTKEDPNCGDVQFYRTLNRLLLQRSNDGRLNINKHDYDDSKKIFNVWLFLFLSGLQKLLVEVPSLHENGSGFKNNTVRLYRGMNVIDDLRKKLWSRPLLSTDENVPHEVHTYSTLAFSSWSTNLEVVCKWFSKGTPCFFIYERENILLPSLIPVSDIPGEAEYLTFPFFTFFIYDMETTTNGAFGEDCRTQQTITWIGAIDPNDPDSSQHLKHLYTSSGGRKYRNKANGPRARKYKNNTKKLNKYKRSKRYNNNNSR
jgi:hypothetical protein